MRCDVVAIGTELLLGQIVDTNSSWLGEQLAAAGMDSCLQVKVGDNQARIVAALRSVLRDADAVIICGGLGPTHDDITREKPAQIARRGIIRSFQISATFPHLTVRENVRIGLQRHLGNSFHFWRSERVLDSLNGRAMELLDTVGLTEFADTVTVELSYGRKRALEIATTLAMEPELMLLDEPTQGMGHEDVDRVTELIRKVSANRTILMVEHNMGVVSRIADTISVLQRGQIIAEGPYELVSRDPQVLEAYMGSAETELQGAHG